MSEKATVVTRTPTQDQPPDTAPYSIFTRGEKRWIVFLVAYAGLFSPLRTISFGYAVVSDIATPAERGGFIGAVLLGPNVAPSLGPVLGGILVQYAGWPWIFWTLAILSGINFCILAITLPETARKIVGNGSIMPARLLNRSYLTHMKLKSNKSSTASSEGSTDVQRTRMPSLKPCFKALWQKENALIMLINGLFYMTYCCYVMNWEYRRVASSLGFSIDRTRGDDLLEFPIEKARLRATYFYMGAAAVTTIGHGWALDRHTHFAIPLVLQFFIGASITGQP
ncbi:unnamed protein product [Alternaria alternata]